MSRNILLSKCLKCAYSIVLLLLVCNEGIGQNVPDTLKGLNLYRPQSVRDTIDLRLKFVQDSILAREKFVKDSILHRQQVLDSLTFLQKELQPLLEAFQWAISEDIISYADKISIIGDSVLSDFICYKLSFTLNDPYTPWKTKLNLNAKGVKFNRDAGSNKIKSIQAPFLNCNFSYPNSGNILIIQGDYSFQNHYSGSFYKIPIDSVFYNSEKKIVKIKRYVHFYKLEANYRKGDFLFTNISQVKQYQYGTNGQVNHVEVVKFRDRYKVFDVNDVTFIVKYNIARQGNSYKVTRRNNPENNYSDGAFTVNVDGNYNITSISFLNVANSLQWQRDVELNKDGNVNCYIDKKEGIKYLSTCIIYHKGPNTKHPHEIIMTSYEKDGTDMQQKNITTQKTRARNKLTLEYGPWQ